MLILKAVKTTGIAFPDYASSKEILDVPRNTNMMEVCQPVVAKTWIELKVKQNVRWLDVLMDEGWRTNFMEVPAQRIDILLEKKETATGNHSAGGRSSAFLLYNLSI